ncbi:hypothetical protein D3C77_342610 [compost metagenome]
MRQALIERHCQVQCQLQRQGLFEQPQGLLEKLIVSSAIMPPTGKEHRASAQARQQQPPGRLQQCFQAHLAAVGKLLQFRAQGCRQLCLNLIQRAHCSAFTPERQRRRGRCLRAEMGLPVLRGLSGIFVQHHFTAPFQVLTELSQFLVCATGALLVSV